MRDPPDFLVETELPIGDLLMMSLYAEPFREPGWLETVVRPSDSGPPTPIWARVMVGQGGRDYGEIGKAMSVLSPDEREEYHARAPVLSKRN